MGCANPADGKGGSKGPITEWDLRLDSFPEDHDGYQVVVQSYSLSDEGEQTNYDSFELGWVKPRDSIRKKITVDRKAQYLSAFLINEGDSEPRYFSSWELGAIDEPVLHGLYWLGYYDWVYRSAIRFGMNADYQQDMVLETDVTLDFYDRPFYILKAPKGTGQTFRFQYHDNQGTSVDVKYASNWASAASSWGQYLYADTNFSIPTADTGMVVVRPISYSGDTRPEAVYRAHNATDDIAAEKARTFPASTVVSVDGGKTLYLTAGDLWDPQNELRQ